MTGATELKDILGITEPVGMPQMPAGLEAAATDTVLLARPEDSLVVAAPQQPVAAESRDLARPPERDNLLPLDQHPVCPVAAVFLRFLAEPSRPMSCRRWADLADQVAP